MAQVLKSTKYFELFGSLNPGTVRVSTENSKDEVILGRCAIYGSAIALFRFIVVIHAYCVKTAISLSILSFHPLIGDGVFLLNS